MLKRWFILSVFALMGIAASAQFHLGVKGAYTTNFGFDENWSLPDGRLSLKADPASGFNLGVMARIGRKFYVQPELLYNWQSYNYDYGITGDEKSSKNLKINSFDIPILLGYKFLDAKVIGLSVLVGPKFRVNMGSSRGISNDETLFSHIRRSQVGLDAGLALDIVHFTVDVRYTLMQNINNFKDADGKELSTKASNNFLISFGWYFLNI